MDKAVERTLRDVTRIEDQITKMLTALTQNEEIFQAPLIAFNDLECKTLEKPAAASRKSADFSEIKATRAYSLDAKSLFLRPVQDSWALGLTFKNTSNKPQAFPQLVVLPKQKSSGEGEEFRKSCKVFRYQVQAHPLEMGAEEKGLGPQETTRNLQGIPYSDPFLVYTNSTVALIQPSCSVLLAATFSQPLNICDSMGDFQLLISVSHNGVQILSKTVTGRIDHATAKCNYVTSLKLHPYWSNVLQACSRKTEFFQLSRLVSQKDKYPMKSLQGFFHETGLTKISKDNLGVDTTVEVYTSSESTILWGLLFRVKQCSRNINVVQCQVSTRSSVQYHVFMKLLVSFLAKEISKEKRLGLTGLTISSLNETSKDAQLMKLLQSELKKLLEIIQLGHEGKLTNANSTVDRKWLRSFTAKLYHTDNSFVDKIK